MLNHTSLRLGGDVEMAHSRRESLIKADAGGQTRTSGPRIFYVLLFPLNGGHRRGQ